MITTLFSRRRVMKRSRVWRDPMVFILAVVTIGILLASSVRILADHI